MTSLHSTNKRNCPPSPQINNTQLFKVFHQTPKTATRVTCKSSTNKEINTDQNVNTVIQNSLSRQGKVQTNPTILSQPDSLNLQILSSSYNDSSLIRLKNTKTDTVTEKANHDTGEIKADANFVFPMPQSQAMNHKNFENKYVNQKRSYRKNHHYHGLGVPYRKCHSAMEEKVVGLINKIKSGKECFKQIQTLLERARKVPTKELSNKYFVSGLFVILKLVRNVQKPEIQKSFLISKIQQVISQIRDRILQELDSIRGFSINSQEKKIECNKDVLIRKAYKILRKKFRQQKKQIAQQKAITVSNQFLDHNQNNFEIFCNKLLKV